MDHVITEKHIEQAAEYDSLTPSYFASRDIVDEYMATLKPAKFDELAKLFTAKIYEEAQSTFETFLMGDAALNIQGQLYRMVDECVGALLGGEPWAFQKYVLAKYNCEEIRRAVAAHIPEQIMEQRLIDLTKENERLRESLKNAREWR